MCKYRWQHESRSELWEWSSKFEGTREGYVCVMKARQGTSWVGGMQQEEE